MDGCLRVFHITPDDKFFDEVYSIWENDNNFKNRAFFIAPYKKYVYKYIRLVNKVNSICKKREIKNLFSSKDYDVIFFHSLPSKYYSYFKYIPKDKIVIWWGWGYDIYLPSRGLPPLIKMEMYKPLTQKFINKTCLNIPLMIQKMIYLIMRPIYNKQRNYALSRIDFYQPVLSKEYELMKQIPLFKAKEFYFNHSFWSFEACNPPGPDGNILLGNSSTLTNNHLDLLKVVKDNKSDCQKIIMPLSYGNIKYAKWLKSKLAAPDIMPLYDFMPLEEYKSLLKSCSYTIIGTMRQQAVGNIGFALSRGQKVFFYRDSILYKAYKEMGFVVFSIEEITNDSFSSPLSKYEIIQNSIASNNEYRRRRHIYEECIREMKEKIIVRKNFQN